MILIFKVCFYLQLTYGNRQNNICKNLQSSAHGNLL